MKQQRVLTAIFAAFVVQMTGCASSPPEPETLSPQMPQMVIDALQMNLRGPVELTVGYCDRARDLPARKQIVALGDAAVFDPTEAMIYELKVTAFKVHGKMLIQITAQWDDKVQRRNILFSREIVTSDGEIGPQSVLNVNGNDSCFTVTAQSVHQDES